MTNLKVRRVRFDLGGDDVPFNWNPQRPAFAMQCNMITFFAPGFEKLIVDATREAIPLMRDPRQAEEANAYLRQEAQHSAAHMGHFRALVRRWPGLQQTMDEVVASYDRLTATKPLAWRLAYTAVIENTFTPYFKVFLDHEDKLFEPGDERVASLFLWHFVEEIEHRSSGLMICEHLTRSRWTRTRHAVATAKHVVGVVEAISRGFDRHVPEEDRGGLSAYQAMMSDMALGEVRGRLRPRFLGHAQSGSPRRAFDDVPSRELVSMVGRLLTSQAPYHRPAEQPLPKWAAVWMAEYERGVDMTTFFDRPAKVTVT